LTQKAFCTKSISCYVPTVHLIRFGALEYAKLVVNEQLRIKVMISEFTPLRKIKNQRQIYRMAINYQFLIEMMRCYVCIY